MECPTCGQPCSREIPELLSEGAAEIRKLFKDRGVHVTPMQAKLMYVLRGKNRPVAYGTILETLYGFRPHGDYPQDEVLKVMATKCRQAIKRARLPWQIVCTWGIGYELEEKQTTRPMRRVALSLAGALLLAHPLLGLFS